MELLSAAVQPGFTRRIASDELRSALRGNLISRLHWETRAQRGEQESLAEGFRAAQFASPSAARSFLRMAADRTLRAEGASALLDRLMREYAQDQERLRQPIPVQPDGSMTLGGPQPLPHYLETLSAIRAAAPRASAILESTSIGLSDIQRVLAADEVLLLLAPGDADLPLGHRRGLTFAVTRERAAWAELPFEPEELTAHIAALHRQLEQGGTTRAPSGVRRQGAVRYDRARAYALYRGLFGAPEIAAITVGKTRWTIAPLGVLLGAPFAALVTEPPQGGATGDADAQALRDTRWLGLERTLSITPGVSAMHAQRTALRPAERRGAQIAFFGLGDPAFDGVPGQSRGLEMRAFFDGRSGDVDALRALSRLQGARREIEQLAEAFRASRRDYVLDVEANERELARRYNDGSLGRAEVIVFATHGLIAGDLDGSLGEPALALTPPAAASAEDDGLLTATEVSRMRLNAEWVILSACNTAAGDRPDAEGLSGLARAFLYAGARALLVSQWSVNDIAAQRLTTQAINIQRERGVSKAAAMRESMLALVRDDSNDGTGRSFAHPSAWSPFILVTGD